LNSYNLNALSLLRVTLEQSAGYEHDNKKSGDHYPPDFYTDIMSVMISSRRGAYFDLPRLRSVQVAQ